MAQIDLEQLLTEVSTDSPSGDNLEYDAQFSEMERTAQRKAEQQFGSTVVAAEEPDWKTVRALALELLERTRDLRIASHLANASVRLDGLVALASCIRMERGWLEKYWDTVHPQLDPDDDNDPTMRINTLVQLNAPEAVLGGVLTAPIVSSRNVGRFSLRDYRIAAGELAPTNLDPDVKPPDTASIDAAFLDCDLDQLQATADAVGGMIDDMGAIDATLMERVGPSQAPDLSSLTNTLKEIHDILTDRLSRRGVGTQTETLAEGVAGEAVAGQPAAGAALAGEVRSREDVLRALDKISDYYVRFEPTSPVPLILQRVRKLVSMSFLEIIKELAPDGMTQIQTITGVTDEPPSE